MQNNKESWSTFRAILIALAMITACQSIGKSDSSIVAPDSTYCNPMNLNYNYHPKSKHREAADPAVIFYKGNFYLFASRSGGYWVSPDLKKWTLIKSDNDKAFNTWAPVAFEYDGALYLNNSVKSHLWKTTTPKDPESWKDVANVPGGDPCVFVDDDKRVYMYANSRQYKGIGGWELDPEKDFSQIGKPVHMAQSDPANRGWEILGLVQGKQRKTWTEGAWVVKRKRKYYLSYASPCTEQPYYADGLYTSDSPLGPFTYADYSPVSYFPMGFVPGAGHGCIFQDREGNDWRIMTGVISVRHRWDRRLNLFPAGVDENGEMYSNTYLADYPQFLPGVNPDAKHDNLVGWMLLSYKKPATASSSMSKFPVENAFDETGRTWWSAASGNKGEWLQVDLGKVCTVNAIQINYSAQDPKSKTDGRDDPHQYIIESSLDGKAWATVIDKSKNREPGPHDYVQLPKAVQGRYFRITNIHTPLGAKFCLSGFRILKWCEAKRTVGWLRSRGRNPTTATPLSSASAPPRRPFTRVLPCGTPTPSASSA